VSSKSVADIQDVTAGNFVLLGNLCSDSADFAYRGINSLISEPLGDALPQVTYCLLWNSSNFEMPV